MLTTSSKSVNSNRCGVSASRSLGPMSGSASIIEKTWSMTSRSSFADSISAAMAQELAGGFAGVGAEGAAGLGVCGGPVVAAAVGAAGGFFAAAAGFIAAAGGFFAAAGRLRAAAGRFSATAGFLAAGVGFFA